jgi:hypothetical protein
VLPPLHQGNPWLLLYSTARDGISLATLMRKAEKVGSLLALCRITSLNVCHTAVHVCFGRCEGAVQHYLWCH